MRAEYQLPIDRDDDFDGDDDDGDLAVVGERNRTNLCAIIGLYSALLGLALPAIVFGGIGLAETSHRKDESGSGMALAAVVIAIIEILVAVVVLTYALDGS